MNLLNLISTQGLLDRKFIENISLVDQLHLFSNIDLHLLAPTGALHAMVYVSNKSRPKNR